MIGLIHMGGRAMRFSILYAFLEVVGIIIISSPNPRVGISLSDQTCSSDDGIVGLEFSVVHLMRTVVEYMRIEGIIEGCSAFPQLDLDRLIYSTREDYLR